MTTTEAPAAAPPPKQGMNPARWTVVVLVVAALALSLVYGLRPKDKPRGRTTSASIAALQTAAALEPCPTGLGAAFPNQSYDCLGGGAYVYASNPSPDKPTLVNLYGSWCGPCAKEMPLLRQFHAQTAGRVALVGVDTEDDFDKGLEFAKDVGQHWPALYDNDGDIFHHFKVTGTPSTVFLDAHGRVVHIQIGAFKDQAQLDALTKQYLGVSV